VGRQAPQCALTGRCSLKARSLDLQYFRALSTPTPVRRLRKPLNANIRKDAFMQKRAGIIFSTVVWLALTIWFNAEFENQTVITVYRVGSIQTLRSIQVLLNVVLLLVWMTVLYFVSRNEPKLKSDLVNIAIRTAILVALLIAFILGHFLSAIIGITHYTSFIFHGITYFAALVVGIWYVLVNTPKIGWKRTLRNGLVVSIILGFIVQAILGIPLFLVS
jgi:hypothetical protein